MEEIMNAYAIPGLPRTYRFVSMKEIVEIICDYHNVPLAQIFKKNRKSEIAYARHLCFYVLWLTQKFTLKDIGDYFNRDHTTVIHGRDYFESQITLRFNNRYREDAEYIISKLGMSSKFTVRNERRRLTSINHNPNTNKSNH